MDDDCNPSDLRRLVYDRLHEWGVVGSSVSPTLCKLLGRQGQLSFTEGESMSAVETSICQALAGVNGYVIYKMLLARRGQ